MDLPEYPYHTPRYFVPATNELETLPCKHCSPGKPCAEFRGTFEPFPGTDARMFIQWKGTDVCMDFHCPCAPDDEAYAFHFDGDFAYYLECPRCGAIYELGTQVKARRLEDGEPRPEFPKMLDDSAVP